jgi:hypothetical protein
MYHNFHHRVYCVQRETRPFDTAVQREFYEIACVWHPPRPRPYYVRGGLYHEQLQRYFGLFDRDQLLVLDSRRLKADSQAVLDEVATFLDLRATPTNNDPDVRRTRRGSNSHPDDGAAARLYKPHNQQLCELLGVDLGWA